MSLDVPEWLGNSRDPLTRAMVELARQRSNAPGASLRAPLRDTAGTPYSPPLPFLLKRARPVGKRRKAIDQLSAQKGWKKKTRAKYDYRRQQGVDRDLLHIAGLTACRDHLTGEILDPHWRRTGEKYLGTRRLAELTGQPISRRVRRRANDSYVAYEAGDRTERAIGVCRVGVISSTEEFRAERRDAKGKKIGGYESQSMAKRIIPLSFYVALGGQVAFEAVKGRQEAEAAFDLDKKIQKTRDARRKKEREEKAAIAAAEGVRFKAKVDAQRAPAPDELPPPPPSMRPPGPSPELVEAIMQEADFAVPMDWPRAVEEARRREREQQRARAPNEPDTS